MVYTGIDPSFTKTGVCYLDTDSKEIKFVAIHPKGTNDEYKKILDRSASVAANIISHMDLQKEYTVIIEEPLLAGRFKASSLGILSGIVVWTLAFMPKIKTIYSINPSYISSVNSKLKKKLDITKKAVSQHVASEILEYLEDKYNYDIELFTTIINKDGSKRKRQLSHDEAESFLLLNALLMQEDFYDREDLSKLADINSKLLRSLPKITKLKGE